MGGLWELRFSATKAWSVVPADPVHAEWYRIEPAEGISVVIHSVVEQQFGEQIRQVACTVLENLGVTGAAVDIQDYGALDCVIAARVETAVRRAGKEA